jgi:mannose-6-phosphate isomerase
LTPKQQAVVWGGDLLHTRLVKAASDEPIGESWEVWEGDPVAGGPYAGSTLGELTDRFPNELMGEIPLRRGLHRFPLLTKFIDARQPLSVQVHPNDEQARKLEGQPNGKTEAWYILQAESDAWIIHGLSRSVDAGEFRSRLEAGTANDLLRKVRAVAGETIFVPAGTIHAIGSGILLHEVQQTSDVTYRLYDWNRQSEGSTRELHLDKGIQVSWLQPSSQPVVHPLSWTEEGAATVDLLLAAEYFAVKRVRLTGEIRLDTEGESFHIVTVLDGDCMIQAPPESVRVTTGQSVVVPACQGAYRIVAGMETNLLVEWTADVPESIVPELLRHGIAQGEIDWFLSQFAPLPDWQ